MLRAVPVYACCPTIIIIIFILQFHRCCHYYYYYFTETALTLKSILVWIIQSMVAPALGTVGCCSARIMVGQDERQDGPG